MLALYPDPDLAEALAIPGGMPPEELHITVAYLGDSDDVPLGPLTTLAGALLDRPPVRGSVSGHGRFTGGPADVIIALIDSADLEDLRRDAMLGLTANGIDVPRDHGYTPHCTLQYQDASDPDPVTRLPPNPAVFPSLTVVHGTTRVDLPFRLSETRHPIMPYAREAYMAGWAASGGPLTPRVLAGCHAAAQWAAEHADHPDVFEVALKLGSLEGAWAVVYRRRQELRTAKTAPVMDAWRTLTHALNARSLISKTRALAGMHGETASPHQKAQRTETTATALAWLYGILDDPRYPQLTEAIIEAIASGIAEGDAGARIIAAEEAGIPPGELDLKLMFTDAYDAIRDLPNLPGMGDEWAHKIIGGAASDLGRVLAAGLEEGASYKTMLEAAIQVVAGTDVRAVSLLMDHAISGGYVQGMLRLYAREGIQLVDWLTAADSRVCEQCQDHADNGPYPPQQFPPCPAHPLCRCTPASVDQLSASAFISYLAGGNRPHADHRHNHGDHAGPRSLAE